MIEAHPITEVFPLMQGEEFSKFVADIKANGLLEPIVLHEGKILDGRNRLRACEEAGVKPEFKEWKGLGSPVAWALAINLHRRHLEASQKACIAVDVLPIFEAEARERQGHGQTAPGKTLTQKVEEASGEAAEFAGKAAGVNRQYVHDAKALKEEAPDLFAEVRAGKKKLRQAVKHVKKQKQVASIAAEPPPLPGGRYRVIVADPPWHYEKRSEDQTHRARLPYPSMTMDDIYSLPVGDRAADDCVLWLWTTNAHMREAFQVLDAWGFQHKTILTWVKNKMGTGDWLRGQTEHCLMAVRGRPTVNLTNQTTVLHAPAGKHSEKPDEFYALVEALCPGSKLEMFSRQPREGWTQHGDEVAKSA